MKTQRKWLMALAEIVETEIRWYINEMDEIQNILTGKSVHNGTHGVLLLYLHNCSNP